MGSRAVQCQAHTASACRLKLDGTKRGIQSVIGVPLEDPRAYAAPDQIDAYFAKVEQIIELGDIPAAIVVNVEVSCFGRFVDTRRSVRIVPREYEFDSVPVSATRAEKRQHSLRRFERMDPRFSR